MFSLKLDSFHSQNENKVENEIEKECNRNVAAVLDATPSPSEKRVGKPVVLKIITKMLQPSDTPKGS